MAFLGPLFPSSVFTGTGTPATPTARLAAISGPLPTALGNLAPGAQLSGTVLAAANNGKQQIRTQQGTLTLTPRVPLPEGGRVLLELIATRSGPQARIVSLAPPPSGSTGQAAAGVPAEAPGTPSWAAGAAELGRRWPGLERLLAEAAGRAGAGTAGSALATALPRPGIGLTQALVLFVAALRAGTLEPLLGREQALGIANHARLGPLAAALRGDMARLERFAFEPSPGSWQGLLAPLIVGDQIRMLRLFWRRDGAPEDAAEAARPRRFIVETEIGQLGPIQLDGLLGERHLDFVLRGEAPLPAAWQPALVRLVSETAAKAGYVGKIAFQTCRPFPISPMEEALSSTPARGVTA